MLKLRVVLCATGWLAVLVGCTASGPGSRMQALRDFEADEIAIRTLCEARFHTAEFAALDPATMTKVTKVLLIGGWLPRDADVPKNLPQPMSFIEAERCANPKILRSYAEHRLPEINLMRTHLEYREALAIAADHGTMNPADAAKTLATASAQMMQIIAGYVRDNEEALRSAAWSASPDSLGAPAQQFNNLTPTSIGPMVISPSTTIGSPAPATIGSPPPISVPDPCTMMSCPKPREQPTPIFPAGPYGNGPVTAPIGVNGRPLWAQ